MKEWAGDSIKCFLLILMFGEKFLVESIELIESFVDNCKLSESIKINIKYLEKAIDKWKKFDIMKLQTNKKVHNKFLRKRYKPPRN